MKTLKAFRLDDELIRQLEYISKKEGRTQTWYISTALSDLFNKKEIEGTSKNEESNKD